MLDFRPEPLPSIGIVLEVPQFASVAFEVGPGRVENFFPCLTRPLRMAFPTG
jgi:hypothetical protein